MTIRAICLDAAGTLIRTREPVAQTYQTIAARHDIELGLQQLGAGFAREFPGMPPLAFRYTDAEDLDRQERAWWRTLVQRIVSPEPSTAPLQGAAVDRFERFFDELYAHYAEPDAWLLFDEILPMLRGARDRGLRTLVVSNFDGRLHPILEGLGVRALVDGVLCSSEVGFAKPETGIFQAALDQLELAPHQVLHVGDNPQADLAGARAVGLHALLVMRGAAQRGASEHIKSLTEALDYCDRKGRWQQL
ncbi:MAG: HAD-IA family hydrolase [Gammaproteobacteria bacterium]|nr:HAD-IA family hydrolase [Gammaproteobacteria bacterium]